MAGTKAASGIIRKIAADERAKPMGRPRSEAARRAALDAAYDVLAVRGISGFSIDAVAAQAKIAKTTIYRSWPSKGLLAVESLLMAFQRELSYADTADVIADFSNLLDSLVRVLAGPTGRIAATVIAEAQSDLQTRQAFLDRLSLPLRHQSGRILARGVANGTFRADLNIPVVLDAVVGGAYLRLLMGQPLDGSWSHALTHTVLQGCFAEK